MGPVASVLTRCAPPMGYPLNLAFRYMGSKKRAFISVGTAFATLGVTLGVAALAIVMSVTGGFQEQFREKVLGVNAHVLVLKYSIDFREYRDVMKKVEHVKGVTGIAPFVINPMMVTHGERTATGVLLKGVDPDLMPRVLDLPKHIIEGSLDGLRKPGAKPPERAYDAARSEHGRTEGRQSETEGDAGAESKDEALMAAIAKAVEEDAADAGSRAPASKKARDQAASIPEPAPPPAGSPVGDLAPAGGYKSVLPPEDVDLPDDVDPDPCKSPEQVAHLPGVVVGKTLAKQ